MRLRVAPDSAMLSTATLPHKDRHCQVRSRMSNTSSKRSRPSEYSSNLEDSTLQSERTLERERERDRRGGRERERERDAAARARARTNNAACNLSCGARAIAMTTKLASCLSASKRIANGSLLKMTSPQQVVIGQARSAALL